MMSCSPDPGKPKGKQPDPRAFTTFRALGLCDLKGLGSCGSLYTQSSGSRGAFGLNIGVDTAARASHRSVLEQREPPSSRLETQLTPQAFHPFSEPEVSFRVWGLLMVEFNGSIGFGDAFSISGVGLWTR